MSKKTADWLNKKFLQWQLEANERQTIRSFAAYLDVKETSLSGWMRGVSDPTGDNLRQLADVLGDYEIYDIVGEERPDPQLKELRARYDAVPPENVQEFFNWVDQFLAERGWHRSGDIRPASPDEQE